MLRDPPTHPTWCEGSGASHYHGRHSVKKYRVEVETRTVTVYEVEARSKDEASWKVGRIERDADLFDRDSDVQEIGTDGRVHRVTVGVIDETLNGPAAGRLPIGR